MNSISIQALVNMSWKASIQRRTVLRLWTRIPVDLNFKLNVLLWLLVYLTNQKTQEIDVKHSLLSRFSFFPNISITFHCTRRLHSKVVGVIDLINEDFSNMSFSSSSSVSTVGGGTKELLWYQFVLLGQKMQLITDLFARILPICYDRPTERVTKFDVQYVATTPIPPNPNDLCTWWSHRKHAHMASEFPSCPEIISNIIPDW